MRSIVGQVAGSLSPQSPLQPGGGSGQNEAEVAGSSGACRGSVAVLVNQIFTGKSENGLPGVTACLMGLAKWRRVKRECVMSQILDPDILAEFYASLGQSSATEWVEKFVLILEDVSRASDRDEIDNYKVFALAHLVLGRAGLVGCIRLVETCAELQWVCQSGEDPVKPFAVMRQAAGEASVALRSALAG